jgi:hypothetical protein
MMDETQRSYKNGLQEMLQKRDWQEECEKQPNRAILDHSGGVQRENLYLLSVMVSEYGG